MRIGIQTIRSRLIISFLLLVILPLVVVAGLVDQIFTNKLKTTYREHHQSAIVVARNAIDQILKQRLSLTKTMAMDPELRLYLSLSEYKALRNILPKRLNESDTYRLNVIDSNGIVVGKGHSPYVYGEDVSNQIEFQRAAKGEGTAFFVADNGRLIMLSTFPIFRGNLFIGAIQLGKLVEREMAVSIRDMTGTSISFFEGDVPVVSTLADGKFIAFSQIIKKNMEAKHFKFSVMQVALAEESLEVRNVSLENSNGVQIGTLVSAYSLQSLNNSILWLRYQLAFICFLVFVVVFIAAYFFSRNILIPIRKLVAGTIFLSNGELDKRVEINSQNEFGYLATSFNKMIDNLQNVTVSKNYFNNIIENMINTLIIVNMDGSIKDVNQATMDLLGYNKDGLIGKHINMIIALDEDQKREEDDCFQLNVMGELIEKGFIKGVEKIYKAKNGRKIPVLFSGTIMSVGGLVQEAICVAQDISELKKLHNSMKLVAEKDRKKAIELEETQDISLSIMEDLEMERTRLEEEIVERKKLEKEKQNIQIKMMQSGKLASLGEIATGVAHEINQPLTYISSFLQNISDDIEENIKIDESKLEMRAKIAYGEVKRITSIIQHLRTFGRQGEVEMRTISIATVFDNTLLLMGERIRLRNVKLIKNMGNDIPMVLGNTNRLEEVFINLLQNACDAFDEKNNNAEIRFTISLSDDKDYVIIEVSDNGGGMKKETLEMVFEPFFTTKDVGKGTGLGLSIAYGTIEEHKGTIFCKSELNKGTTFEIRLPVAARGRG